MNLRITEQQRLVSVLLHTVSITFGHLYQELVVSYITTLLDTLQRITTQFDKITVWGASAPYIYMGNGTEGFFLPLNMRA